MPRAAVASVTLSVVAATLAASVAQNGTFTANYPLLQPGTANTQTKNKGHFFGAGGHKIVANQAVYTFPRDFELTFNAPASGITVTWRNATALAAGTNYKLQLNEMGGVVRAHGGQLFPGNIPSGLSGGAAAMSGMFLMNLTAPNTKSTTGVCAAQAKATTGALLLNGVNAVSGVVYMDVPRCVDAVSSNGGDTTNVLTITGTDMYGQTMVEAITTNGTTRVLGKKAFFKITSISTSVAFTGNVSLGTIDIFGLPAFMPNAGYTVSEIVNGSAAVRDAAKVRLEYFINQTDLLAPTAQTILAPCAGTITDHQTVVQAAVTTGGTLTPKINNVSITGGVATVANAATVRTVNAGTAITAANTVAKNDVLTVLPASFATAGAVNGYLELTPDTTVLNGTLVTGAILTDTTTTNDVRGTYAPAAAADGTKVLQLLVFIDNPGDIGGLQNGTAS